MTSNKKVIAKLDTRVRKALAAVTIHAEALPAFDHFSYQVDWTNFPNSLVINCHLNPYNQTEKDNMESLLSRMLQPCLLKQGIKFRDFRNNIILIVLTE